MNISGSIRKLTQLFVVLFVALSGGLVYWQVIAADQVTANPHNGRHCLTNNAPVRGRIFDRNGILLADSKADPNSPCGYTRHYYDPSLAGLIGYYVPGYGVTGIEKQYDNYLSGQVGLTAMDNLVNQTLHRPPVGDDIYLTIDDRIQQIADKHFDDPYVIDGSGGFPSNRGSVIVTDPHSGEVLAMVSRPGFDPNQMVQTLSKNDLTYYNQLANDTVGKPLRERPIQELYTPGSTYKTMTLLAALDSGHSTLNQEFDQKQAIGPVTFNGHNIGPVGNNIQDYTLHFPVDTAYGFSHSDNVIFAQLGVETGQQTWLDYNKRFYVGEPIPFDLPVTPSSVLSDGKPLSDVELATDAFGQNFDNVTPMQMTLFDNAIANNGNLMRPMLLSKITDKNKNAIRTFNPTSLGNPISSQTATDARQAMYGVTFCGSGSIAHVAINGSPWGIIAKTGTGQVSDTLAIPPEGWITSQAPYSLSNPSQLPALTIVSMRENAGEGGQVNGPMQTAIYNDVFTKIDTYANLKQPGVAPRTFCCTSHLLQRGCP